MARIPPDSNTFPRRGAALRGVGYIKQGPSGPVFVNWPKKRGAPRSDDQLEAQTYFRIATQVVKNMDPLFIAWADEVSQGAPLLPRDMLMMSLYGRFGYLILPDGTKVFSVASYQDVSLILDAIGQLKGDMMYRDETFWKRIPAGLPNEILAIDPTGIPHWTGGGSAGSFKLLDAFTYANVPTMDLDLRPYLGSYSTLQIRILDALPVNNNGGLFGLAGVGSPITWLTGGSDYFFQWGVSISLPASGFTGGITSAMPFNGSNTSSNDPAEGLDLTMESCTWDLGTRRPRWKFDLHTIQDAGYDVGLWGTAYVNQVVQQTGMQFAFNNGNTDRATIRVYGIV